MKFVVMNTPNQDRKPSSAWIPNHELVITRRNLPHWTMEGAWYFITFRVISGMLCPTEVLLVLEHIKSGHARFYRLIAVCVMPDHVHVILTPNDGVRLLSIVRGIKGPTARAINRPRDTQGSLWQDERWDRIIRDEEELYEKLNYMLQNSVKKGLVEDVWAYPGWYLNSDTAPVAQTFSLRGTD
jgi:REP element-mobilizing transposase RayT